MFQLIRTDLNIDFLKISKPFVWASTIAAVASLVALWKPGLNYGIDFTGGAELHLHVPEGWDTARLRASIDRVGLKDPVVVSLGEAQAREYLVKVQAEESRLAQISAQIEGMLKAEAPAGGWEIRQVDVVGPAAGANLRNTAFLAILYATLCIAIYIAIRFDIRYAPGVLRALLVDVIITLGVWVAMRREFNLTVVASMMTIAGYSCNDTIVIYDRIRDFTKNNPDWNLAQAINRSINLNLGRTLLTSICTLMVVVSLFLLGGPVLQDFALPMLIGFTISIFSTIFVANPMILYMEERRLAKERGRPSTKGSGHSRAATT